MRTLKAKVLAGCLLMIALPGTGQEKALTVKASFSHKQLSTMPASVSRTEVNRVLAKKGDIVEDKVYSQNGRIEARIEPPLNYNSEDHGYEAYFTYVSSGENLGRFKVSGELLPANDGKHFVTFGIHGGWVSFYSFVSQQPLRVIGGANQVRLSEDGSKVLVATYKDHSVELKCFQTSGEDVWSTRIPYTNLAEIAINYDGTFAALSAYLLDPQNIEKQKKISETIAEAKRQWAETNRQRRAQNLPMLPFTLPVFPDVKPKSIQKGQLPQPTKTLIFLDNRGTEIGRTEARIIAFRNLVFSRDGGHYLATSSGNEIYLFDASNAIVLHQKALELSTEVNTLDVNRHGEIAAAVITHPTKVEGGAVDRGLSDPRIAILWNPATSETKKYEFDSNLQIPRDQFFVSLNESADPLLVKAAEQFFVFEK